MISKNFRRIFRTQKFYFSRETDTIYEKIIDNEGLTERILKSTPEKNNEGP